MTRSSTQPIRDGAPGTPGSRWHAAGVLLLLIAALAAGAITGGTTHIAFVLPALGLGRGEAERIVTIARTLPEARSGDRALAICIGNSISVEGYDAALIEEAAGPQWKALSLAINGCDPSELLVLLPAVLEAEPDAVILTLRPADLGVSTGIPPDKAYAYALSGMPGKRKYPLGPDDLTGTSQRSIDALSETTFRAQMHFRSVLLSTLNSAARTSLRSELRQPDPTDLVAPFQMLGSIKGATLDRHLEVVAQQYAERIARGKSGAAQIERIVREIRAAGARPILVAAPQHPRLAGDHAEAERELLDFLHRLATQYEGTLLDASQSLASTDFADALHPNRDGRARLSELVGRVLPPILPAPGD